jgi:hypothetical protein
MKMCTSYVDVDEYLKIYGKWTKNDITSSILDEDIEEEFEDYRIESIIRSKETKLTLETLNKYIEGNKGMGNLFKPLSILENGMESNVLNEQK